MGRTRDYTAACGCIIGLIATVILITFVVANWRPQYKLAGLEVIFVGPLVLLLYSAGLWFGTVALRSNPHHRMLASIGVALNGAPLIAYVAALILL